LKADDELAAKKLYLGRAQRDHDAAEAARAASEANLKANNDRFTYEKDQLYRGENQDRLKFVEDDTASELSRIEVSHHNRQYANSRLMKRLASF